MTWEASLTLAVLGATIAALVTERISPTFAVLGGVVVLLVTGVIEPEQAFSGFSRTRPPSRWPRSTCSPRESSGRGRSNG